jgi:hypothetical protein
MSTAYEKLGGLSSRWSSALVDLVKEAIEHGVTPREMVQEIQECWDISLHDQKKYAAQDFYEILSRK